jgi:hypothetical protein
MIPVDARLAKPADVSAQGLDVGEVIEAFRVAKTQLNIVVLDACRDNPFSGTELAASKGLAPLDAPPGTLLAFATAPGNVAQDAGIGDGQNNGLYTGFLLRELKKPQARIEDVFKRVRFSVRQQSQGKQIPWETTSLEDDFSFAPPAAAQPVVVAAKPSPSARELAFEAERADWAKVSQSNDTAALYAFLQKHPAGSVSALAYARIELLQKPQVLAVVDQSGLKVGSFTGTLLHGDEYEFTVTNNLTKRAAGVARLRIVHHADGTIEGQSENPGVWPSVSITREGFIFRDGTGTFDPPYQVVPNNEFKLGSRATVRTVRSPMPGTSGSQMWQEFDSRVAGRELLKTAFGEVMTWRIEMEVRRQDGWRQRVVLWYDPEWGYALRLLRELRGVFGAVESFTRETTRRTRLKAA